MGDISRELDEIRDSRPTPIAKRWRPAQQNRESVAARSQSAHSLRRTRLPDDAWVVERSASRLEEERLKAVQELEEVKRARQETLEVIENGELERPSSRAEAENRTKALRELEEVKLVQLSHEKRVQDSYKKTAGNTMGNTAEKAKEEIYRETIASQRAKRERFESESKEVGNSTERTNGLREELSALSKLREKRVEEEGEEELHGRKLQQEEMAKRARELAELCVTPVPLLPPVTGR